MDACGSHYRTRCLGLAATRDRRITPKASLPLSVSSNYNAQLSCYQHHHQRKVIRSGPNGGLNAGKSWQTISVSLDSASRQRIFLKVLDTTLGLNVDPSEVRLKPNNEDRYRWRLLPGCERSFEHLFEKHMSKQTKGIYMELWREVGRSFEAVAYEFGSDNDDESRIISFSDQIEALCNENARLEHENATWKRDFKEWEVKAQKTDFEYGRLLHKYQELQQQHIEMSKQIRGYKNATLRGLKDLQFVLQQLEGSEIMPLESENVVHGSPDSY
jgi:hypothetical protein